MPDFNRAPMNFQLPTNQASPIRKDESMKGLLYFQDELDRELRTRNNRL